MKENNRQVTYTVRDDNGVGNPISVTVSRPSYGVSMRIARDDGAILGEVYLDYFADRLAVLSYDGECDEPADGHVLCAKVSEFVPQSPAEEDAVSKKKSEIPADAYAKAKSAPKVRKRHLKAAIRLLLQHYEDDPVASIAAVLGRVVADDRLRHTLPDGETPPGDETLLAMFRRLTI